MKKDYFNTFEPHDFDISEDMELNPELQSIFVPMETWFNADKKFGINVANDDNAWVDVFTDYNPATKELHMYYAIDTYKQVYEREYIMTDEERNMITNYIEQQCQKKYQMSCMEFYLREYIENYMEKCELVCEHSGEKYQIRNSADDFVLYCEDETGTLKNHIGHKTEIVKYGDNVCVSLECSDCHEVLYSTDIAEEQTETQEPKQEL